MPGLTNRGCALAWRLRQIPNRAGLPHSSMVAHQLSLQVPVASLMGHIVAAVAQLDPSRGSRTAASEEAAGQGGSMSAALAGVVAYLAGALQSLNPAVKLEAGRVLLRMSSTGVIYRCSTVSSATCTLDSACCQRQKNYYKADDMRSKAIGRAHADLVCVHLRICACTRACVHAPPDHRTHAIHTRIHNYKRRTTARARTHTHTHTHTHTCTYTARNLPPLSPMRVAASVPPSVAASAISTLLELKERMLVEAALGVVISLVAGHLDVLPVGCLLPMQMRVAHMEHVPPCCCHPFLPPFPYCAPWCHIRRWRHESTCCAAFGP